MAHDFSKLPCDREDCRIQFIGMQTNGPPSGDVFNRHGEKVTPDAAKVVASFRCYVCQRSFAQSGGEWI